MNCRESRALFSAYWDDELTQAEREWLEAHFASCPSCRREYDDLTRTLEIVGALPRVEVSSGFAENVLARARRKTPARDRVPTPTSRWVPLTAVGALVAVLGAATLQWVGQPGLLQRRAPSAQEEPTLVEQPVRIGAESPAQGTDPGLLVDAETGMGEIPDSLFDHTEDVEFILDAVTLRKGRAHTVTPLGPEPARAATAVITF